MKNGRTEDSWGAANIPLHLRTCLDTHLHIYASSLFQCFCMQQPPAPLAGLQGTNPVLQLRLEERT